MVALQPWAAHLKKDLMMDLFKGTMDDALEPLEWSQSIKGYESHAELHPILPIEPIWQFHFVYPSRHVFSTYYNCES